MGMESTSEIWDRGFNMTTAVPSFVPTTEHYCVLPADGFRF
jgi:hypothetical protein